MFDPLWDLAAYSMESGFSESEEEQFFSFYFKRPLSQVESERVLMHKIFQDYLWSLWTMFKEAKGDDFGIYGQKRFERAKKNIKVFEETFRGGKYFINKWETLVHTDALKVFCRFLSARMVTSL